MAFLTRDSLNWDDGSHRVIAEQAVEGVLQNWNYAIATVDNSLETVDELAEDTATQMALSRIAYELDLNGWDTGHQAAVLPSSPGLGEAAPAEASLSTISSIDAITLPSAPGDEIAMSGVPDLASSDAGLTDVTELEALTLPPFTSTVPTVSVDRLEAQYSYIEPTYDTSLQSTLESKVSATIGGALLVAQSVWDEAADRLYADVALKQVASVDMASQLPARMNWAGMTTGASQTLLARANQDSTDAALESRYRISRDELLQKREDILVSIQQAIAFEGVRAEFHNGMANRALASAAKAHDAQVAVFNSNIAWFNLFLQRTIQEVAVGNLELERALVPLREHRENLESRRVEIAQKDHEVSRNLARFTGWGTDKSTRAEVLGRRLESYNAKITAQQVRHATEVADRRINLDDNDQKLREATSKWQNLGIKIDSVSRRWQDERANQALFVEDQKVRQGWSRMEMDKELQEAAQTAAVAQSTARLKLESLQTFARTAIETISSLAQGFLSAAETSVGTTAPASYYNSCSGTHPNCP